MDLDPLRAITVLESESGPSWEWAEVRVTRGGQGWCLRHRADAGVSDGALRRLGVAELLEWADVGEDGRFRPLRGAPTLRRGWFCEVWDLRQLEDALNRLYPGSVADWWAAREPLPPATHLRDYVGRQTGMYRAAQRLSPAGAGAAVRACCHEAFCLKRRLWCADGAMEDAEAVKSRIPCLEPCAVMLEMARRAAKLEGGPVWNVAVAEEDRDVLLAALEAASGGVGGGQAGREGDLADPGNPRRIRLLLERLRWELNQKGASASDAQTTIPA